LVFCENVQPAGASWVRKGHNIARRTVAKYREQLNIPVARLRKEL
jgi:DNA-directed RNA polymerase specialized sigma54-like protein